jgi:hypothetical protein
MLLFEERDVRTAVYVEGGCSSSCGNRTGGCALSSKKAQEMIRAWDWVTPWLGITDGIDAMQGGCSPRRNRSTYGEQDCKLNRND